MAKLFYGFILLLMIGLVVTAQAGVGSFLYNTSLKITHPVKSVKDIAYGKKPWQTLNIYPQKNSTSAPVVIFIYGGGWHKGSKEQHHFVADALVRKGYLVVIPDYVKYPQGQFPTFIEDIAGAIAWVKNNISDYGGNPDQLFLAGHSAGAHTGALLITDNHYLREAGADVDDIKAFVGLAGPYNFTPQKPQYIKTFGRENFDKMKANPFVDGSEPPVMLIHSQGDNTVGRFNMDTFYNQLFAAGVPVEKRLYQDIGHVMTVLKVHPWFADEVDVGEDMDAFFKKHLTPE